MTADPPKLAALDYAQQGCLVFPVHSVVDAMCSCHTVGCKDAGKHPRTRRGLNDATTDPSIIQEWWRCWPDANVAIRTGPESGIVVVDIDPRHGGDESLEELLTENGELPLTIQARTGGGGRHLFFAYPESVRVGNRANVRPGIDVRGANGYIVAPPSRHASGGSYEWIPGHSPDEADPAALPDWLLSEITHKRPSASKQSKASETVTEGDEKLLLDAAARYVKKVEGVGEGSRNDKAFGVAGHLASFVLQDSGLRLSEVKILHLMKPWNLLNSPPLSVIELDSAIHSAMVNGTPREPHIVYREKPTAIPRPAGSSLPEVALPGGNVRVMETAARLGELIADTRGVFMRGGVAVRLKCGPDDKHELAPVKPASLPAAFEAVASLVHVTIVKDKRITTPTICSEQTARVLLHSEPFVEHLPVIRVLSRCPVLIERDRQLIQITGYDRESGVLAAGRAVQEMSLGEAHDLLELLIADFRFATPGDRARALAAIVTPAMVFGGLMRGRAPIDLGEADESQAGKGFRNKLTATVYNDSVTTITQRKGGVGSLEERFDSCLIRGKTFLALDNVRGRIDSPAIESFMTEDSYVARAAYSQNSPIDPRGVVVMMTSNKAEITPDFANRSSCVRILKQPVEYVFESYAEGDLLDHVHANSERYLGAVFAIIKAWYNAGRPRTTERRHSFREWAQILDWIVQNLLATGPLLEGHGEAQSRMSTPTATWVRDLVLCIRRNGRTNEWLRTSTLLDLIAGHAAIGIPGVGDDADLEDDAVRKKALTAMGRRLGQFFARTEVVTVDGFQVERREGVDQLQRKRPEYRVRSTAFKVESRGRPA